MSLRYLLLAWLSGVDESDLPQGSGRDEVEEGQLKGVWTELFPSKMVPGLLARACCTQFAVSRERIKSIRLGRLKSGGFGY